jgi:hypothetical protein
MSVESASAPRREFSPVTVVWLVLTAVFALSALGVLSAYAPDLRRGDDGGAHALSKSAVGYAGAVKLLRATGTPVVISRGPLHRASKDGLLILTPTPGQANEALEAVRYAGPVLIVLPKWMAAPDPKRPGWVRAVGAVPPKMAAMPIEGYVRILKLREDAKTGQDNGQDGEDETEGGKAAPVDIERRADTPVRPRLGRPDEPGAEIGPIRNLQTLTAVGWTPVRVDETGRVVVARLRNRPIYVLADPDMLNTHGLHDLATARFALGLIGELRAGDAPVVFDVTLNGLSRPRSVLRLALEPPFLGVTACALALALLVGLQAFARFGAPRASGRAVALGKRALADNTAGLVRMARREHRMAPRYALLVRAAVARAVGAPRDLDDAELDALLDRLGASAGAGRYTPLAAEARAARTAADLMRVARKLHDWKLEMTRERQ